MHLHDLQHDTMIGDSRLAAILFPFAQRLKQKIEDACGVGSGRDRASQHETELERLGLSQGRVTLCHAKIPPYRRKLRDPHSLKRGKCNPTLPADVANVPPNLR